MTLLDLGSASPAISPAFDTGCANACTVLTCSCMPGYPASYWTSTTFAETTSQAWYVSFDFGGVAAIAKTEYLRVRAVRGGSVPGGGS